MRIVQISQKEWNENLAKNAHMAVFGEEMDPSLDRSDYTLVAEDDSRTTILYMTVIEMTSKDVCLEFGGSFDSHRGSVSVPKAFKMAIGWLKEHGYRSVNFVTRNDNYPMLKLGFFAGFKIVGCSLTDRGLVVQNSLNLEE